MISWECNFLVNQNQVIFSDYSSWSVLTLIAVLFIGMMIAHILKNNIKKLNQSLIPASVLGGIIILLFTTIYNLATGESFFDLPALSICDSDGNIIRTGSEILQIITYHALGLGFVATSLRSKTGKNKPNFKDVFNTGCVTVSTYLMQASLGIIITIIVAKFIPTLVPGSGVILALAYGQGTGQALTWGNMFQTLNPDFNGSNFGLTLAAMGFLSASIGGVVYLMLLKKRGKINTNIEEKLQYTVDDIQIKKEVEMTGSIDKFTIQTALVVFVYAVSFLFMYLIGQFVGYDLKQTIFGFNFFIGTLFAILLKWIINKLTKKGIIKRKYINDFMMNRIAGIAFDIMIVAGIAVIDLRLIKDYWSVILILSFVGLVSTLFYIRFCCHKLFPNYKYEQFCALYGMLTGTASTGMILLREIDPNYETPASDNLVYQNLPAMLFGLPLIMWIVPRIVNGGDIVLYLSLIIIFFIVMQFIQFRSYIFKKKK